VSDLCRYHEEARRQVQETYQLWKEAYGALGWEEYLDRVIENPETGQWAIEAAGLMRGSHRSTHAVASPS
jgi:hypothetical protein